MNFVDSFILATAFSYLVALVLPIQFEKKMPLRTQKVIYAFLFTLLILGLAFPGPNISLLWGLLGLLYSFMAVYCFGGGQDWGSNGHNLFMTTWDLTLAVCFFMKVVG